MAACARNADGGYEFTDQEFIITLSRSHIKDCLIMGLFYEFIVYSCTTSAIHFIEYVTSDVCHNEMCSNEGFRVLCLRPAFHESFHKSFKCHVLVFSSL